MKNSNLEKIHKELAERVMTQLKSSIRVMSDEPLLEKIDVYSNAALREVFTYITFGYIDRGPRYDSDHLSENQINSIAEDLFKKHDYRLNEVKGILESELSEFSLAKIEVHFEYGEKGHISIGLGYAVQGKFSTDSTGEKIWIDMSGIYGDEGIVVMTPDVERYADSLSKAEEMVRKYVTEKSDLPF